MSGTIQSPQDVYAVVCAEWPSWTKDAVSAVQIRLHTGEMEGSPPLEYFFHAPDMANWRVYLECSCCDYHQGDWRSYQGFHIIAKLKVEYLRRMTERVEAQTKRLKSTTQDRAG